MFSMLGWISKEDELRGNMIDMISKIESINAESHVIFQWLWDTLGQYEELYGELYNVASSDFRDDELIVNARIVIKTAWEFISWSLEILNNEETSLLDKNNLYPMLIDTVWMMILNYQIIVSRLNYLSK